MEKHRKNKKGNFQVDITSPLSKKDYGKDKRCNKCSYNNHKEATFCGECGKSLDIRQCQHCGVAVSTGADFCESCKEWLLPEDICRFCGSSVDDEQAYCGACGNPPSGIVCNSCGQLSNFDYCKKCNTPLTEQAVEVLELVKKEDKELINLIEIVSQDIKMYSLVDKNASQVNTLNQIKSYAMKVKSETLDNVAYPYESNELFSDAQRAAIKERGVTTEASIKERDRILAEQKRLEEERKRKEEAERKRRKAERLRKEKEEREKSEKAREKLILQMKNKEFNNNQEARRYHRSIKPSDSHGWICNFADVEHCCPEDCADPSHGGYWVM